MRLAIFDFDGTITRKDSFIEFLIFTHGRTTVFLKSVSLLPMVIGYLFKTVPNWKLKEHFLDCFYKGWSLDRFNRTADQFAVGHLSSIIRPMAVERLRWHKRAGHQIVVVSASLDNYLRPWCKKENIDLLATELEIRNNRLTGRIQGTNCYGEEKMRRLKEHYRLADYEYTYAYGDSGGDLAFKSVVNEFHFKTFR